MKLSNTTSRHSRVGGNPQGGEDNTTDRIPLSLDGRGIKGEGDNHHPNPANPPMKRDNAAP